MGKVLSFNARMKAKLNSSNISISFKTLACRKPNILFHLEMNCSYQYNELLRPVYNEKYHLKYKNTSNISNVLSIGNVLTCFKNYIFKWNILSIFFYIVFIVDTAHEKNFSTKFEFSLTKYITVRVYFISLLFPDNIKSWSLKI